MEEASWTLLVGPYEEGGYVVTNVVDATKDDDDNDNDNDDDDDNDDDNDDDDDGGGTGNSVPGAIASTERLGCGVASNVAVR